MQITRIQIRLVRRSFSLASTHTQQIAALFFDRLFELDPDLRPLFNYVDTEAQGERVMRMLALVVSTLDNMDSFEPAVKSLGERHINYGVRDEHYQTFNAALLWALEQSLGTDFTPAMREAWRTALALMSKTATDGHSGALT